MPAAMPHTARSSRSGCGAIDPEELFDGKGRFLPEIATLAPEGKKRMGALPHANGGMLKKDLLLPDSEEPRARRRATRTDNRRSDPLHGSLSARGHPP